MPLTYKVNLEIHSSVWHHGALVAVRNAWVFCPKHLREKVEEMLLEKQKKAGRRHGGTLDSKLGV